MAAKKTAPRMLVEVSNHGGNYTSRLLLSGAYRGSHHQLGEPVCEEFENQTGIVLKEGQTKVFRMELIPQRKRR